MTSEVVSRPVLRQCAHPDANHARGVSKGWRVWLGRFFLGTVYQLSPRGRWFAVKPTGNKVKDKSFPSSNAAIQNLQGLFEIHKPKRGDEEAASKSPYLRYPLSAEGVPEVPPQS